jgi:chemotaxis protein methyltransferase CheR
MTAVVDIEIGLLLEAVYARYGHDFRDYAAAALKRRILQALPRFGCETVSQLQDRVVHDPGAFSALLQQLTIQVSDLFRDPPYFRAVRERVVPLLLTYPSVKLWVAGCASGEEVYSFAILLEEAGLLDRSVIYATDVHPEALRRAEAGVYALDRFARFTGNYQQSGGTRSLSDYYVAAYQGAVFDRRLRRNVVFSDHSLATDSVFAEVEMVSCRNVLIYFDRRLQDRAVGLFTESLCPLGFLGIGARESLRPTGHAHRFADFAREERIYRRTS